MTGNEHRITEQELQRGYREVKIDPEVAERLVHALREVNDSMGILGTVLVDILTTIKELVKVRDEGPF